MAVTYITRIYSTIDKSIDYIIRDKIVLNKLDNISKNDIKIKGDKVILTNSALKKQLEIEAMDAANNYMNNAIDYVGKDKTTSEEYKVEIRKTLTSSINCYYDTAKQEFKVVREQYEKNSGGKGKRGVGKNDKEILGYHVWQSFEEKIDAELANDIGVKLAKEMYGDYQCVISTHTNTEHTHNHIVFNAVSVIPNEKGNYKKYNICTKNTKLLREVSDRLCEEHGLSVLRETKDMKLKWYKDENGNLKCWEPTERKMEKIKGEYSNKKDYRNYEEYTKSSQYKKNNWEIIRKDIDTIIPLSKNLDDFIEKLENIGYEVKNLNKKNENLKFIAFKSPCQENFTRGNPDTLGENYTRENIIKRIDEVNKLKKENEIEEIIDDLPAPVPHQEEDYSYDKINDIDDDKRKRYNRKNDTWEWIKRNDIEKYVIKDIKKMNQRVDEIYKNGNYLFQEEKKYYGKHAEYHKVVDRINENLKALQFIEEKNINSFFQINGTVKSLLEKNEQIEHELSKIMEYLKIINQDVVLIKHYNALKESINVNNSDNEYRMFEMQGEKALKNKYEKILKMKGLLEPERQEEYAAKVENYNDRYLSLVNAKEQINQLIKKYDMTVQTIDRIDKEYDMKYRNEIKEFYDMENQSRTGKNRYKDR